MSTPLTDEKIAELRRLHGQVVAEGWVLANTSVRICYANAAFLVAANNLVPQLLDEVVHSRTIRRLVGACPPEHGMEHAAYCGGCCAQFDPGRMVLVHETRCRFRGHERAER